MGEQLAPMRTVRSWITTPTNVRRPAMAESLA
jgi:hypothetical protein